MDERSELRIILKITEQHLHSVYHQQKQKLRYNVVSHRILFIGDDSDAIFH